MVLEAVAWAVAGHRGEHTLRIHCPSSGSFGGLAVVADIILYPTMMEQQKPGR